MKIAMTRVGWVQALLVVAGAVSACSGGDDPEVAGAGGSSGSGGSGTGSTSGTTGATGGGPPDSCALDAELHTGEATYYDFADGSGNCSFDPSPGDLMIGAMNHDDYADSAACGACVRLTGPNGEITIRVVDQCPECPAGDIDLSPEAFTQIAELSAGRVPISWRYVACDVQGPVVYHFKEGSNEFWTAVQIRNHRSPIATVEIEKNGAFQVVPRESYNYFVDVSGMGPGPYHFRLTDTGGNVIEDTGIPLVPEQDAPGQAQFPPCTP
jgi:expansin (peptidoglycan-binding protein)